MPHRLPVRRLFWRLGLIWPLLPLLLALWPATTAWTLAREADLLSQTGVEAEATIIRAARVPRLGPEPVGVPASRGRATRGISEYWISYHFTPDGHEPVTRSEFVSPAIYHTAGRHGIRALYAPRDPTIATLDLHKRRSEASLHWWLAAGLLLLAGALGWWQSRPYHALLPILLRGERRNARVMGVEATGTRMGWHEQGILEWRDSTGLTGVSLPERRDWLDAYQPGCAIIVHVDPKTGRGWWEAQM